MPTHVVKQGEHIWQIAEKYGFYDHRTIWDHPNNASIKGARTPGVLFPGDEIHIPDKEKKDESKPTGAIHTFVLKKERLLLKLQIKDHEDNPIADTPVKVSVEGDTKSLTTDGDGKCEREVLKTAVVGTLFVTELEVPLKIGHLDPVDKLSGQKARLNNLGYDAGDPAGPEDMKSKAAVEEFQCDHDLDVDGVCGPDTQGKLKEKHGS
jgi:N-acetylmuramoyl-L-alanine amidase